MHIKIFQKYDDMCGRNGLPDSQVASLSLALCIRPPEIFMEEKLFKSAGEFWSKYECTPNFLVSLDIVWPRTLTHKDLPFKPIESKCAYFQGSVYIVKWCPNSLKIGVLSHFGQNPNMESVNNSSKKIRGDLLCIV